MEWGQGMRWKEDWAKEQAGPDGEGEAYIYQRSKSYLRRRPEFSPRSVHVWFMVDIVVLGQVFLLSTSVSPLNSHSARYCICLISHPEQIQWAVFRPQYQGTDSHLILRMTLALYPLAGNFTGSATEWGWKQRGEVVTTPWRHIFLTSAIAGGEWLVSRLGCFTPGERASGTLWTGVWVNPRVGLDDMEERKFLTLPEFELRLLGRPARSQSLYWLRYPGSPWSASKPQNKVA
jgi:hypothetical protein